MPIDHPKELDSTMTKIAFAGTDGRTLLCAWVVSTATGDHHADDYQGVVIPGTILGTPYLIKFMKHII